MSLREKIKRRFTKKFSSDSDNYPPRRKDIEYYKPHEIPKSKYRGKVDKAHQASLEAYSMANAFKSVRRKSSQALSGSFSPGGTQAQSRRPSYASRARSNLSTATSVRTSVDLPRASIAREDPVHEQDEASMASLTTDDTDSPKSDFTTRTTTDSPQVYGSVSIADLNLERTTTADMNNDHYNNYFSAEELEKAMTQATLRPRRGTVIAPVIAQPEGVTA